MEIKIENIDYSYKKINYKEKEILKNLNLKVRDGKVNAIVGINGIGKTTLLNLINSELIPTKGKIKISENAIYNIGSVEQIEKEEFISSSVKSSLESILQINNYKLDKMEKRIHDVLIMVGLNFNKLNCNPKDLSHGELKKFLIAQSLICNPKILILDEPVVNLDSKSKDEIVKLIRLLKNRYNKTIIVVSNDLDFIHKIADHVFILYNKSIVLDGNKYDVFKDPKILKRYGLIPPKMMLFSSKVLQKKNIKIGYRDEINDLIKDIYRYVK